MIVKAVLAIIGYIADFVFSLLPGIPVLPEFIGQALSYASSLMVQAAGLICWFVTPTVYAACLDFLVLLYGWKLFATIFGLIKKYILMRGS